MAQRIVNWVCLAAASLLPLAGGCADKLETGYEPQRLSATVGQRRAYYAPPFSPESQVPDEDKSADVRSGRHAPGGGY